MVPGIQRTDETLLIILGAVLALPYVWTARKRPWLFAAGLVIAAAIYVVFALVDGDVLHAMGETCGVLLFAAIALGGLRWSPYLLAAGWLGHAAWDLLAHPAPWWYPALCIGFDVLVAGFIAGSTSRRALR